MGRRTNLSIVCGNSPAAKALVVFIWTSVCVGIAISALALGRHLTRRPSAARGVRVFQHRILAPSKSYGILSLEQPFRIKIQIVPKSMIVGDDGQLQVEVVSSPHSNWQGRRNVQGTLLIQVSCEGVDILPLSIQEIALAEKEQCTFIFSPKAVGHRLVHVYAVASPDMTLHGKTLYALSMALGSARGADSAEFQENIPIVITSPKTFLGQSHVFFDAAGSVATLIGLPAIFATLINYMLQRRREKATEKHNLILPQ